VVLKSKPRDIGLTSLGLVLIAFSLIWLLVIFPAMAKLPADHHRVMNFDGVYKVMNSETQSMDDIPVSVVREQRATEVVGNVLMIDQTVVATHAQAGMELPQFGLTEVLGVDRSTREYVPGYGDTERSGRFSFPEGVEKASYSLWMPSAGRPLEARFSREEDFHGLRVFTFKISELDLDIGVQAESGLPQVLDTVIEMKVEPVSGTTVASNSITIIKIIPSPGMKVSVYVSSLEFAEDTTADLVDTARSARTALLWARVYGFWIGIGLGAVFPLGGGLGGIRSRSQGVI